MHAAVFHAFADELAKIAMSPLPEAPKYFTGRHLGELAMEHASVIRRLGGLSRARRKEEQAIVKHYLLRQGRRALPMHTVEAL